MGFASAYLSERSLYPELIKEAPDEKTGIIVVVPAYDEPGICRLLDSLAQCTPPACKTEVIVVVNAPSNASPESLRNNQLTIGNIENWKRNNHAFPFRLYAITIVAAPDDGWGVGMARKSGMDEAARRFNAIGNPDGVILSLDADCLVARNYFISVFNGFSGRKEHTACSIYFEHPLSGDEFPEKVYRFITLYELHLRYYLRALAFSGFPYLFHTVGSAMGVKAYQYVKAGGMNRKQAGEDFYFIQKLVPSGGYFNLNSTTVYPSPRPSFRVPFGTGASIARQAEMEDIDYLTYNLNAFRELKSFFKKSEDFYENSRMKFSEFYASLPEGVKSFAGEKEIGDRLLEIRLNTSGFTSYKKRFFGWFNMFRVVKYLNHVHSDTLVKKPVVTAAMELLEESGIQSDSDDPAGLLHLYRSLERGTL
jgi:hypothetical protein